MMSSQVLRLAGFRQEGDAVAIPPHANLATLRALSSRVGRLAEKASARPPARTRASHIHNLNTVPTHALSHPHTLCMEKLQSTLR